jgi:DDE superfamily endonuclease
MSRRSLLGGDPAGPCVVPRWESTRPKGGLVPQKPGDVCRCRGGCPAPGLERYGLFNIARRPRPCRTPKVSPLTPGTSCLLRTFTWTQSSEEKAPWGAELTPPEKAINRHISSVRIRIEHAIGGVKRYRMVKDNIRLLKDGIRDSVMETCCGVHNFLLRYRPWYYVTKRILKVSNDLDDHVLFQVLKVTHIPALTADA